jgi:nitrite reductase/ring-hydroxylating ferredoxin subunit
LPAAATRIHLAVDARGQFGYYSGQTEQTSMSEFVPVAKVADLKPGECRTVMADGRELALFNVGGKFYCLDNVCPHRGGPLGEGTLDGNVVTCPWHGWRFDVTTGVSPVVPTAKVEKFDCVIEGNDVKVKVNGN